MTAGFEDVARAWVAGGDRARVACNPATTPSGQRHWIRLTCNAAKVRQSRGSPVPRYAPTRTPLRSCCPIPTLKAITTALVNYSNINSFKVISRIAPEQPRDANDHFYPHALRYFADLAEVQQTAEGLPTWLLTSQQGSADVESATKRLLQLCLTYFQEDEARKVILLAAAAFRRLIKAWLISSDAK